MDQREESASEIVERICKMLETETAWAQALIARNEQAFRIPEITPSDWPSPEQLGRNVLRCLNEQGKKPSELMTALECSEESMAAFFAGKRKTTADELIDMADFLGMETFDMVYIHIEEPDPSDSTSVYERATYRIARNILQSMIRQNMSISELAGKLNVSESVIRKTVFGQKAFRADELKLLAAALHTPVIDILYGQGSIDTDTFERYVVQYSKDTQDFLRFRYITHRK